MENKLTVKLENMEIYEVDVDNPPFSGEDLTEEELDDIAKANDAFIETKLTPELIRYSAPCGCRMNEFMARHQKRAQLLGIRPGQQYAAGLEQVDVDAYRFGIILTMENGRYTKWNCIVKECKVCHRIEIFGDSRVITRLLAESFTHYADAQLEEDHMTLDDLDGDEYVMENIGEESDDTTDNKPADSKVVNLFGGDISNNSSDDCPCINQEESKWHSHD